MVSGPPGQYLMIIGHRADRRPLHGRKIDPESGSASRLGVDDVTAALLHDAVNSREPEPGSLPGSLVVKNGSNRCSQTSSVMPVPVSTRSAARTPGRQDGWDGRRGGGGDGQPCRPPASRRARSPQGLPGPGGSSPSMRTGPSRGCSTVAIFMLSPIRRRSIPRESSTIALRSSTSGWSTCRRLKASSRGKVGSLSAALRISSRLASAGS